jgi:NADPH-dependent curcumin reductase CurA
LRDAGLAVRELNRVAKLGCHAMFVGAAPPEAFIGMLEGRNFGKLVVRVCV